MDGVNDFMMPLKKTPFSEAAAIRLYTFCIRNSCVTNTFFLSIKPSKHFFQFDHFIAFDNVTKVSAHTIEAWVKSQANDWNAIVGHLAGPSEACGLGMYLAIKDNLPLYGVDISGCGNGDSISKTELSIDRWTHLAGTYDGSTMRFYVNGEFVGEKTVPFNASGYMTAGATVLFNGPQGVLCWPAG